MISSSPTKARSERSDGKFMMCGRRIGIWLQFQFLLCLAVGSMAVTTASAQAVHEVLRAVQERKLVLWQKVAVQSELGVESASLTPQEPTIDPETGEPGPLPPAVQYPPSVPPYPLTDDHTIDWGEGLSRFPSKNEVEGLSMPALLRVLNKAAQSLDSIKGLYLNVDTGLPERIHPRWVEESGVARLPAMERLTPLAPFDESNWRANLSKLASNVSQLRALSWSAMYGRVSLSSFYYSAEPEAMSVTPAMPFLQGAGGDGSERNLFSAPRVADSESLYAWASSGYRDENEIAGEEYTTVSAVASVVGVKGMRSRVKPQHSNASSDWLVNTGTIAFYKAMPNGLYSTEAEQHFNSYLDDVMPVNYLRLIHQSQGAFTIGDIAAEKEEGTADSALVSKEGQIRNIAGLPSLSWSGGWAQTSEGFSRFKFNTPSDDAFDADVTLKVHCVCFPAFTAISGEEQRSLVAGEAAAPGSFEVTAGYDLARLNLGRGLYDRRQTAFLDPGQAAFPIRRLNGFGNPLFVGSESAFRVLYETRLSRYPNCLVPGNRHTFVYGAPQNQFTQQERENTGWYNWAYYARAWYQPRMRQIFGNDIVVDITHDSDYKKTLRFYWAKNVNAPPANVVLPISIGGTPFKTVVIENPHLSSSTGLPNRIDKLRVNNEGTFWDIEYREEYADEWGWEPSVQKYTITSGTNAGASNLSSRVIDLLADPYPNDSLTRDNLTIVTENTFQQYFDRHTAIPLPNFIKQGDRKVNITYQWPTGGLPIKTAMSFSGDSTWEMNGAQYAWSTNGVTASETRFVEGRQLETTHNWNGKQRTSVSKLGGGIFRTVRTTISADLLTETIEIGNDEVAVYKYDVVLGTLKEVEYPGGYRQTFTVVPDVDETEVTLREGWSSSLASGTIRTVTTNRWGGLIKDELKTSGTESVTVSQTTGANHTGWGAPRLLTGLRNETTAVTYNTAGYAWGLPTQVTSPQGVVSSVSNYDAYLRPMSINNGFQNVTPNYSNPLQPSVSVQGLGTISAQLTEFGETTAFSDGRPGGASVNLNTKKLSVDGRMVDLDVTNAREVLGRDSGLGSRGAKGEYSEQEGKLCLTTTHRRSDNGAHFTTKTFFDGQGRVVKVVKPHPGGSGTVQETWDYNDEARSVTYTPPAGGKSRPVTSTISSGGSTLTVAEENGRQMRYTRNESNDKLVMTTEQWDDSDGTAGGWVQVSQQEVDPGNGVSQFTPWNLSDAAVVTDTSAPSGNMNISSDGGTDGGEGHVTVQGGLTTAVSGRVKGVDYNLDDWDYDYGRLTKVSGSIGGKAVSIELDSQGRISKQTGPGYNKTFSYGGGSGFEVTIGDSVQGTSQTFQANSVGDLTQIGGDGLHPMSASTVEGNNGVTETTYNESLTVGYAAGGEQFNKDYPAFDEGIDRAADGTVISYGVGPERVDVAYDGNSRTTTPDVEGSASQVAETFYKAGPRKTVSGPHGDQRENTWERGQLKSESHTGGTWSGTVVVRAFDDRGHSGGTGVSGTAGAAGFGLSTDVDGRPGTVTGPGGFSGTYGYHPSSGQVTSFSRGGLTTSWNYDTLGRMNEVRTTGAATTFAYDHDFSSKNLRTSRSASGAGTSWNGMQYDSAHRLTHFNGSPRYNYDNRGNREGGSGSAETWIIDNGSNSKMDQVTGRGLTQRAYGVSGSVEPGTAVRVFHPGADPQLGENIAVDPAGNYSASWTVPPGFDTGVSRVEILVRGTLPGGGNNGSDAVADDLGWVVVPATSETFGYDGAGRLTDDSNWTYAWNSLGRLTGMTRKLGAHISPQVASETLAFQYDADGRRVKKTHFVNYLNAPAKTTVTETLWDGWLPVMERKTVNEVEQSKKWFTWGRDVSGSWDGAGGIGGLVAIREEGGRTLLPVEDGLGNIMAVVDQATGSVVAKYDHGPFGEVWGAEGEADACPFRYQSKLFDEETGLYYFGYRYYSPKMGRWLSRDPLGEAGGFNLYAYCGNDPVNSWDYLGLETVHEHIANAQWAALNGKYLDMLGSTFMAAGRALDPRDSQSDLRRTATAVSVAVNDARRDINNMALPAPLKFVAKAGLATAGNADPLQIIEGFAQLGGAVQTHRWDTPAVMLAGIKQAAADDPEFFTLQLTSGFLMSGGSKMLQRSAVRAVDEVAPSSGFRSLEITPYWQRESGFIGNGLAATKEVILDTNAVYNFNKAKALLHPGEIPVITHQVLKELNEQAVLGKLAIPTYVNKFKVVSDTVDISTQAMMRKQAGGFSGSSIGPIVDLNTIRGLAGDGIIGTTGILTGRPIITSDVAFYNALSKMRASVRFVPNR